MGNIHFYDSASPQNIPSGVHAAAYVNGFAWPESEIRRMATVFRISVLPDASWARVARCLDIERGAAGIDNAVPFAKFRRWHWGNDVTMYVNRSNWQQVAQAFTDAKEEQPRYWVATLDGTREVTLEHDGKVIRPWAVQYTDDANRFDLSVLYGKWHN